MARPAGSASLYIPRFFLRYGIRELNSQSDRPPAANSISEHLLSQSLTILLRIFRAEAVLAFGASRVAASIESRF